MHSLARTQQIKGDSLRGKKKAAVGFCSVFFPFKGWCIDINSPMAAGTSSRSCAFPKWQGQKRQHVLLLQHEGHVPREHRVREIKTNANTKQNPPLKEGDDFKLLVIKGEAAVCTALRQPRSSPHFCCSACSTFFFSFCKNTEWILLPFLDINMQSIINCELLHWVISLQECQAGSVLDQPL